MVAQIKICAINQFRKRRSEVKNYFEYTVKHFQEFGPHHLITMRASKSMEKEVRDFYQDGQRLLYDDDLDWEIAEEWERQYFFIDGK